MCTVEKACDYDAYDNDKESRSLMLIRLLRNELVGI